MNRKTLLILIAVVGLCFIAFLGYVKRASDPDRLFSDLINQMKTGKYKDIYANSSDFLHLNADKEKFTERMADALEKMKRADVDLNFSRDKEEEISIENIQRESDRAVGRATPNNTIFVIQKLGTGDNAVSVLIFWEHRGLFPKFSDLAIMPIQSERQDLRVKGIAYQK